MRPRLLRLALVVMVLALAGQASAGNVSDQARENTKKRVGHRCDRIVNCVRSEVEACWRTEPHTVACRGLVVLGYGPEATDNVRERARFVWAGDHGEVTLVNRT